ncbi:hypothetical protein H2248_007257 [Termitomyces sp. 'cryptogamus']|nr:hypothetical protein H2248_007257 [Termitomyces sp. 'cryptogamus']
MFRREVQKGKLFDSLAVLTSWTEIACFGLRWTSSTLTNDPVSQLFVQASGFAITTTFDLPKSVLSLFSTVGNDPNSNRYTRDNATPADVGSSHHFVTYYFTVPSGSSRSVNTFIHGWTKVCREQERSGSLGRVSP